MMRLFCLFLGHQPSETADAAIFTGFMGARPCRLTIQTCRHCDDLFMESVEYTTR